MFNKDLFQARMQIKIKDQLVKQNKLIKEKIIIIIIMRFHL